MLFRSQRCTRGCEDGSDFCKSHGAVDGKKCADCSAYHGEDVVHGFKHEHLGTIHEKSYVIDKFWNDLSYRCPCMYDKSI